MKISFVEPTARLQLLSAVLEDSGLYTCEVLNDAGSASCSSKVTVQGQLITPQVKRCSSECSCKHLSPLPEPPSFVKAPGLVEGVRGKDASLHCELKGTPPFQLAWSKDQTVLKDSRKYRIVKVGGSITLHVIKLEHDDAGTYQCQVSNQVGTVSSRSTISLKGEQKPQSSDSSSRRSPPHPVALCHHSLRATGVRQEAGGPVGDGGRAAASDGYSERLRAFGPLLDSGQRSCPERRGQ